jgi:hypothetical protein
VEEGLHFAGLQRQPGQLMRDAGMQNDARGFAKRDQPWRLIPRAT